MTEPIRPLTPDDQSHLVEFVAELPEGDRTFFKEEVDEDAIRNWCRAEGGPWRWALDEDDLIKGIVALIPGTGWSSHVAELRLVVGATCRRQGVGRRLARHGLSEGLRLGFGKIVVEVVADREGDIAMFTKIGFRPEALLEGQIRDRAGEVRDLVVLAHQVDEQEAAMRAVGIEGAVGAGRPT